MGGKGSGGNNKGKHHSEETKKMIKLKYISGGLAIMREEMKTPGLIILNEKDFIELKKEFGVHSPVAPRSLLGVKLLIIPAYLENSSFLELGKSMVIEKKFVRFLMEKING